MSDTTLLKLALRNATRRPMRTALTAGMVVAGTALLVICLSWLQGMFGPMLRDATNAAGHVAVRQQAYVEREQLMPLYENLPETAPLVQAIRAVPGVVEVHPRIATGGTLTVSEEIGEVFGLVDGASKAYFTERQNLGADLVEGGRWFEDGAEEMVLGARVAEEAGVKLGDEAVLLGTTQDGSLSPIKGKVVGIVSAGTGAVDRSIYIPLERARWLVDIPEGAIELLVYGEDYEDAGELSAALSALPALDGLAVQAWSVRPPWSQMGPMVDGIWAFLIFVTIFLAALGIWNTMMMSVLERTDEIGVLRAMGLRRRGAVGLFVIEALSIGVIGSLVGLAVGAVPAWYLATHGIELSEQITANMGGQFPIRTTIKAALDGGIFASAFACGLVMALIGSVLPAIRAALISPVTAMRSGR